MSEPSAEPFALRQRYAHAVFCESVRPEVSGQLSLVGVYPGRVVLPATQDAAVQVRLAAAVWLVAPIENLARSARLVLRLPDGSQLVEDMLGAGPSESAANRAKGDVWTKVSILDVVVAVSAGTRLDAFVDADGTRYFAGAVHFWSEAPSAGSPPTT